MPLPINNEPETSKSIESYLNTVSTLSDHKTILPATINKLERDPEIRGLYKYNEFSHDVEHTGAVKWSTGIKDGEPVTDNDILELMAYIAKKYDESPSVQRIEQAVQILALRKRYHPIKDYLEALQWDGVERLDKWLIDICGCTDNEYTRAVGRKVLAGAVKRIYEPGCQFDYMLILEGEEGIGKTTLVKILGSAWYSTINFGLSIKELVDIMRGQWILEVKEMHGFDRVERSRVKALIDQTTDRVRLSYGRRAQNFKRNSILIGTMNPEGENKYLDESENRRFWPVACRQIDLDGLRAIVGQLWAEALIVMRAGEVLYLRGDEDIIVKNVRDDRRYNDDPWDIKIEEWLKLRVDSEKVTATQLMSDCLKIPVERQNRGFAGRVGRAVKKCGWVLKREITGKHRGYFYVKENGEYGVSEAVQEPPLQVDGQDKQGSEQITWED